jgi:hypothetical protein
MRVQKVSFAYTSEGTAVYADCVEFRERSAGGAE